MPAKQNLIGRVFRRLTVLSEGGHSPDGKHRKWCCRCECGTICYPTTSSLNSGHTKSCGCLNNESRMSRAGTKHPNWKGGNWNKGSVAYCQTLLCSLRGHARKGNYRPPDITAEELSSMIFSFAGQCPICKIHTDDFCLDHNHDTGRPRGLICRRCNHLLGCANDDLHVIQSAHDYLLNHTEA